MANRRKDERARIRAARYEPGAGFEEGLERTLRALPPGRRPSLQRKILSASSIAAAAALFLMFAAPPIVRAASELYQRLFGEVVQEIEDQQALPEEEKLAEMTRMYEEASLSHDVQGASAEISGVTAWVQWVRVGPVDKFREGTRGQLDLMLHYSKIPPFDPSHADFTLVADGREIPMRVDEQLRDFRAGGGQTLTEAEWADDWSASNSMVRDGVPGTWLFFDLDTWQWTAPKQLELRATLDGQSLRIPFAFDPVKARENALERARTSVALGEDRYLEEKDELDAMRANAVSVGLTGTAYGHDWAISEISCADDLLYFTAAFGGVDENNPSLASHDFYLNGASVDGLPVGIEGSEHYALSEGTFTTVYKGRLARDPAKLPEESILTLTLDLGSMSFNGPMAFGAQDDDEPRTARAAFRYNWKERRATLPADEAEMRAWIDQADAMGEAVKTRFPKDLSYNLSPLNLIREKGGVAMKISRATYSADHPELTFTVKLKGNVPKSDYEWLESALVTINGQRCEESGMTLPGKLSAGINTYKLHLYAPLSIAEFAQGETVVIEYPLRRKEALKNQSGDNAPEPEDVLRFEFTLDAKALNA